MKGLLSVYSAKHLHSSEEQLMSLAGSFGYVAPEVLNKKGHGKAVDLWSTGYVSRFPSVLLDRSFVVQFGWPVRCD